MHIIFCSVRSVQDGVNVLFEPLSITACFFSICVVLFLSVSLTKSYHGRLQCFASFNTATNEATWLNFILCCSGFLFRLMSAGTVTCVVLLTNSGTRVLPRLE